MSIGFRTAVIQSRSHLSLNCGEMVVTTDEGKKSLPIKQIRSVMITTHQCGISSALANELAASNVNLLFCNEKHQPIAELTPFGAGVYRSGNIMDQATWTQEVKDNVWQMIVKGKIGNQIRVLLQNGLAVPEQLLQWREKVQPGDITGAEAKSASLYFSALFGSRFRRHAIDDTNAALNYGYSILMSTVGRIIRSHGFITELGIHHHNRSNPHNLSCDLMEPFRPLVDWKVYSTGNRLLDSEYKKELIELGVSMIKYKGKMLSFDDCVEQYFLDFIREMNGERNKLGEVVIVGKV